MKTSSWRPEEHFSSIACHPQADGLARAVCELAAGTVCVAFPGHVARTVLAPRGADEGGMAQTRALELVWRDEPSGRGGDAVSPGACGPRLSVSPLRSLLGLPRTGEEPRVVGNAYLGPWMCRPLQMGADVVVEDLATWLGVDMVVLAARSDRAIVRALELSGLAREESTDVDLASGPGRHARAALAAAAPCVQRRSDNALVIARYLQIHPQVAWVSYPGLPEDDAHEAAYATLDHGFGPLLAFGLVPNADGTDAVAELLSRASGTRCLRDAGAVGTGGAAIAACGIGAGAIDASGRRDFDIDRTALLRLAPGAVMLRAGLEDPLDVVDDLEGCLAKTAAAHNWDPRGE